MTIEPNSFEFNLLLTLTIILLAGKLLLTLFLLKKIFENRKKTEKFEMDFVFGMFILILCFFISRLFYTYFDFFLTEFDSNKYHLPQYVIFWKLGGITYLTGTAILMFIIDKKVLKFKYKGIFAYIIIAVAIYELLYPINTAQDFEFVTIFEMIGVIVGVILFPVIFIYLGIRTPRLRMIAFTFAFGIIIYAIGSACVAEFIIESLVQGFGPNMRIIMWILSLILKLTGLIMISYSCTKFY